MTLALKGIRAGYGDAVVVDGASITVPAGSVTALLGPNGAGKTTLLRVATGLLRPVAGQVVLDGEDLAGLSPHETVARGLCHVPEGRGVFPTLTVHENLLLFAPRREAASRVRRAVEAFPVLGERLSQAAGTLSGGEQQMLALARAYTQQPRVVLLDEVSMGLAPIVVDAIYDFLRKLAADGAALLLVEQYVSRALALADYLYLMNRGRIVFAGEPAELDDAEIFARYLGAAEEVPA